MGKIADSAQQLSVLLRRERIQYPEKFIILWGDFVFSNRTINNFYLNKSFHYNFTGMERILA